MNESHDQPMMDNVEEVEMRLPLSEDEHKILELWDKLQELRLEIAIINAQDSIQPGERCNLSLAIRKHVLTGL